MERDLELTSIPKVHLHLHLEATIRPMTILELYQRRGGKYGELKLGDILRRVRMDSDDASFSDFLGKFQFMNGCLDEPADLVRVTREAIADAESDGVCCVELRFCPHSLVSRTGIEPLPAIEAVLEGLREGMADFPAVTAALILIIDQRLGPDAAGEVVRWATQYHTKGVRAIDIAGDPTLHRLEDFVPACSLARDKGLGLTVHAGELQGPETVRVAVEQLGSTRVGHGVRSVEDQSVLDLLVERGVTLEVCVSSNLYMRVFPDLERHALPRLINAGIRVTINSDDPIVFNTTLSHEYELVQGAFGLTAADFRRMNLHALDAAFIDDSQRLMLRSVIEEGYATRGTPG